MSDFASMLASRRKELGLSQGELAKLLHVTRQAVSKWENGKGIPEISILMNISEVIGMSVDELLTGNEPEKQIVEKVIIQEKEVVKPMPARKILAIVAPIVLVVVLAASLMGVYIPKAIAVNTPPISENPEPEKPQPIETNGTMQYRFDLSVTDEITYLFRPKYSGNYVFTFNDDDVTCKQDGVEVKSGYTQYYVENTYYKLDYKTIPGARHEEMYGVYAEMTPEILETNATIQLKRYNNRIFRFTLSESTLYYINTGDVPYEIYYGNGTDYKKVKSEGKLNGEDVYFLNARTSEVYYVTLSHASSGKEEEITFTLNNVDDLEKITADKTQTFQSIPISGKAGGTKFFEVSIETEAEYSLNLLGEFSHNIDCNLHYFIYFNEVHTILRWFPDKRSIYQYGWLNTGKYYLKITFNNDFAGELYFN